MFSVPLPAHAQAVKVNGRSVIGPQTRSRLAEKMEAYVQSQQVANLSFAAWQDGTLVAEGYFGPIGEAYPETVSENTIYRIRSMTKPITAVGLLILMERGHFELSDPITKFLPEFEATETLADYDSNGAIYTYLSLYPPTMTHLLNHSAGFAYWGPSGGIIDQRLSTSEVALAPDTDTFVERVAQFPYIAMPGSEWNYSLASDLQGAVIERITGMKLSEFLAVEIFQPLGMSDTAFFVPSEKYVRLSDVTDHMADRFKYVQLEADDYASQSRVYEEGGHGLYSTISDYHRFLEMLLQDGQLGTRTVLKPSTVKAFRTNAIKFRGGPGRQNTYGGGAGLGFGLGVGTIENRTVAQMAAPVGSYYWYGALGTWFWVDPKNDIIFVGMVQNASPFEIDPMRVAMAAIYGEVSENTASPPPRAKTP